MQETKTPRSEGTPRRPVKFPLGLFLHRTPEEHEVVKQAEDLGYFRKPNRDVLLEASPGSQQLADIECLSLPQSRIRLLGDIGNCHNLTVCTLNNNFITSIDSLGGCMSLVKLDLHSNQINSLPNSAFWAALQDLKCLCLHDNPISSTDTFQTLSSCANLAILTMYDTPVSLRKNYRHNAVNSIHTLKALDNFVVSDEEIIEGAKFSGRFSALNPSLAIENASATSLPANIAADEIAHLTQLLRFINRIQAHNSPVLIVQRFIRGFLARRQFGKRKFERPKNDSKNNNKAVNRVEMVQHPNTPVPGSFGLFFGGASVSTDFNTDMLSKEQEAAATPDNSPKDAKKEMENDQEWRKRRSIVIDLKRLHSEVGGEIISHPSSSHQAPDKSDALPKKVHERNSSPEFVDRSDGDEIEEMPWIDFRLKGFKKQICTTDLTMDMIIAKRDAARDIRRAEAKLHSQMENRPKPTIHKHTYSHVEQRITEAQATMSLSSLFAIDQAYQDRKRLEKARERNRNTALLREQRDLGRQRIRIFKDTHRNAVLDQRMIDQRRLLESLEAKDLQQLGSLLIDRDTRRKSSAKSLELKSERTFAQDFNVQNNTVTNALLRHDRKVYQVGDGDRKASLVSSYKAAEDEQREIVSQYLQHRTLSRQNDRAVSRVTLYNWLQEESANRLTEAKLRVANRKLSTPGNRRRPATVLPAINYTISGRGLQRSNTQHSQVLYSSSK